MVLSKQELSQLPCIYQGEKSAIYRQDSSNYGVPVIIKLTRDLFPSPQRIIQIANEYSLTKDVTVPGIRQAFDIGSVDDQYALVLAYVDGTSISQEFVQQTQPLKKRLAAAILMSKALGKIHQLNIIHKNINSHNVLFNPKQSTITIIDFSVASHVGRKTSHLGIPETLEGNLSYISPEQTGRINRFVDYRSDLYSLGIVFYEMFAGVLPFQTTDLLELIHSHIAKSPVPLEKMNPEIPEVLSDIVKKLVAKNAEDRYQSCFGLIADLEECGRQLEAMGDGTGFKLGTADFSERLEFPQKLYEREQETQLLEAVFDRVSDGKSEIVMISGKAGSGKTALLKEFRSYVSRQGGLFISGSFDTYQSNIPYQAITQAVNDLVKLLLTESTDQLSRWKSTILEAVGNKGQPLFELIPSLEWIIGPQPAINDRSPSEEDEPFSSILGKLIQAIGQKKRPLVIFIDDLQWADDASIDLCKQLMTQPKSHHLLCIGGLREDQMSHSKLKPLFDTSPESPTLSTIQLTYLSRQAINAFVSDTLRTPTTDTRPLVDLLVEKTGGDPSSVTGQLQMLYESGLLTFSDEERIWKWDTARIQDRIMALNTGIDLIGSADSLPIETREILKFASCVGNTFTLRILAENLGYSPQNTLDHLWNAVEKRVIIPLDNNYRSISTPVSRQLPPIDTRFEFASGHIRKEYYSSLTKKQQRLAHLAIGRFLTGMTTTNQLKEQPFDVADHLNEGFRYLQTDHERQQLAELNLSAGRKSKNTTAYQSAIWYLSMGIGVLPAQKWEECYDLTRDLYLEAVEAEYLSGHFDRAKQLSEELLIQAKSIPDKTKAFKLNIQALVAEKQNDTTVKDALSSLGELSVMASTEQIGQNTSSRKTTAVVDTASIIKASHSLSQELNLERLLDNLIRIVLANAGAEKGILVQKRDERFFIQAIGHIDQLPETILEIPLENSTAVPQSVVNYVAQSKTPLVLKNASADNTYRSDKYILENQTKSLMCLPIIRQSTLSGVLYLENNQSTNVFTHDRIEFLNILSTQAAISIENAILYTNQKKNLENLKQAEKSLRESEKKYRDVFDNATIAVCVIQNQMFKFFNAEAIRLFGYPEEEIPTLRVEAVIYAEDMDIVKTARKKPESGNRIVDYSHRIITKDGQIRWVDVKTVIIDWESDLARLEFYTDITERKRTEELFIQTEKMMSIGGLAAGMAHEINNPLGGMLQGVQNVQRRLSDSLNANQKAADDVGLDLNILQEYLEKRKIYATLRGIQLSGKKATEIVSNMLQFSRKSESSMAPNTLSQLLDQALKFAEKEYNLKKRYDFRNIKIVKAFDPDLPSVSCTETEIEQVILNLVRNSAWAMSNEKTIDPQIILRLIAEEKTARIEIEDNGPGMDEATRKKIFEPFYTTKPVGEGTGLGLSVSYMIITNNHEGTMEVESETGKGTKFIIRLPYHRKTS